MERHKSLAFVIILLVGSVTCEETDKLACCPPASYVVSSTCYDPNKNTTSAIRIVCEDYLNLTNFKIVDGKLDIWLTDDFVEAFDSDIACHGNGTKDKTLSKVRPIALVCITNEEEEIIVEDTTLGYCMIVSVVFLGLTAIIYAVFTELRDLFGKSVINFCGSLAIGLAILSIMKLMTYTNMDSCAARGFLGYFFLMAAFFWTNSISIQVLRDTRRPTSVDYGWKEFRWYMLYSWGSPTILTTIMAIVNYHPGDHDRPGIGLNHCWFLSKAQQWYYMYGIMTILLVVNFGIFIYIATMVWRFTFQSSHIKALKFKLSMTVRLIILMGLPWIFEMISSAAGGGIVILAIVDVFNSLQGVLVFIVLVLRKRVVKILHRRGLLECCSGPVERWLAVGEPDVETIDPSHTVVPMEDNHQGNGHVR